MIGLIGAIGSDLKTADGVITRLFRDYGYDVHVASISTIIRSVPEFSAMDRSKPDYYNRMIDCGNFVCKTAASKSILAELAVAEIAEARPSMRVDRRRAFVIHSLKRPDEVRMLREIYGDAFYAVAIYAAENLRAGRLTADVNRNTGRGAADPEGRYEAQRLIRRDERERFEWGQKVSDTFGQADYFIRTDDEVELERSIKRFLELVFRRPYLSPTQSEVAMAQAYVAGLCSADMSRQIGAVVASRDGRILSTGCNEVPRPGGGQYWAGDPDDKRDFKTGRDMNDEKKREAIIELLDHLDSVILPEHLIDGINDLYARLVADGRFDGTRIDSLIEFGRVAHAEMAALNNAMLGNVSPRDCDVYSTTFPCHMCTRLLILAGVRNVFYIEPYPKSAALEMYEDTEIRVNPPLTDPEHIRRLSPGPCEDKKTFFLPFEGVAPRRYHELFANTKQKKNDGTALGFDPLKAKPRRTPSFVAKHLAAETYIVERVQTISSELRPKVSDEIDVTVENSP